jgi:hypothetical protein
MLRFLKKKLFDFYFSRKSEICLDIADWAVKNLLPVSDLHGPAFDSLLSSATGNARLKEGVLNHRKELSNPLRLIVLENVKVRDEMGVVELPDGQVVLEGNWSIPLLTERRTYRRRFDFKYIKTQGNVFSLLCLWGKQYYHWFYDVLPRLEASIEHLPSDIQYLINDHPQDYQLESLKAYGIGEERLIIQPTIVSNRVQTLWFATSAGHSGFSNPELLRKVSQRLVAYCAHQGPSKKYYLSRSKAKMRRVVNENELLLVLRAHGIEWMCAEDLDFREQVQCFSNAKAILGPHGAGLANLLFMPAGGKCGEMFGVVPPTCYEMGAAGLGMPFARLQGDVVDATLGDMWIDPKKFAKWLEEEF